MLDVTQDIQPLAAFKKNAGRMIGKAKRSGRPLVLTVKGKAEAVVLGAAVFQRLVAEAQAVAEEDPDELLRESLEDVAAGRYRPLDEVFRDLDKIQ